MSTSPSRSWTTGHLVGPFYVALAATIWGVGYFIRKIVLTDVDPTVLTAYTYLVVALAFLFSTEVRSHAPTAFRSNPALYLLLGSLGVFASWSFHCGLQSLPLSISVIFEKIQPLFSVALALLLLEERFPLRKSPYGATAIVSAYVLVAKDPFSFQLDHQVSLFGLAAVAIAAFLWALAGVVGKKAVRVGSPKIITAVRIYVGVIVLVIPLIVKAISSSGAALFVSPLNLLFISLAALGSTLLGYLFYYKGLQTTDVGVSSFIELTTPLSGVLLGVFFLHETLTPWQIVAAISLVVSVMVLSGKSSS